MQGKRLQLRQSFLPGGKQGLGGCGIKKKNDDPHDLIVFISFCF